MPTFLGYSWLYGRSHEEELLPWVGGVLKLPRTLASRPKAGVWLWAGQEAAYLGTSDFGFRSRPFTSCIRKTDCSELEVGSNPLAMRRRVVLLRTSRVSRLRLLNLWVESGYSVSSAWSVALERVTCS